LRRDDDSQVDMDDLRVLDDGTLDRLLSGAMDPDDAPRAFIGVAELVAALIAPATASELAGQAEAVAAASAIVTASAPTLGVAGWSSGQRVPAYHGTSGVTIGGPLHSRSN